VNTLEYLWPWLCDIARSSRTDVPLAIHSQSGDRTGWGLTRREKTQTYTGSAIRAMPFSRTFLRRVDHELPPVLRQALASLRPSRDDEYAIRSARKAQWRVVASVVRNGETDTEACRTRLGMTEYQFRVAAVSGILALRSALEREA
jgi:hypothetical protein